LHEFRFEQSPVAPLAAAKVKQTETREIADGERQSSGAAAWTKSVEGESVLELQRLSQMRSENLRSIRSKNLVSALLLCSPQLKTMHPCRTTQPRPPTSSASTLNFSRERAACSGERVSQVAPG